jgi:hypothetical protein
MRLFALLAVLSFAPTLQTEAHAQAADFSGTWRLDLQRSDPRRMPGGTGTIPLTEAEIKISMVGEDVRVVRNVDTPQGARVIDMTYSTDGKPHEVTGPMGAPIKMRAKWAKDKLRVSYTLSRGGFDIDITDIWSLSDEGELTLLQSSRVGEQMNNRKEIYVRVPEGQTSGD